MSCLAVINNYDVFDNNCFKTKNLTSLKCINLYYKQNNYKTDVHEIQNFGLDYIQTMEEVSNVSTKMVVWGLRLTFYWKTVGHASKCTLDYKGRYLQPCNDSNQEKKTYCLVR